MKQLVEVLLVGRALARVARAAHAGPAAERRGLDAGVLADRRHARGIRNGAGLPARVLGERLAGLRRQFDVGGQRDQLDAAVQHVAQLAELVVVA